MKEYCEKYALNNCQWVSSRTQIMYDCRRGDLQVEKERKRKEGKNMAKLTVTDESWIYMDEGTLLSKSLLRNFIRFKVN
jgi:hypothetical protein